MTERRRYLFPASMRLSQALDFRAAFDAQVRQAVGPLVIYGRPNGLAQSRLGLSVPRRVGNAAIRHRVKRMLRESFRLAQHDLPAGYDLVVVVRPHSRTELVRYREALAAGAEALHQIWKQRTSIATGPASSPGRRPGS